MTQDTHARHTRHKAQLRVLAGEKESRERKKKGLMNYVSTAQLIVLEMEKEIRKISQRDPKLDCDTTHSASTTGDSIGRADSSRTSNNRRKETQCRRS